MLLRLVKTNQGAGNFLFLLIIGGICLLQIKLPHAFPFVKGEEHYILFGLIHQLLAGNNLWSAIVVTLLLLIIGVILFRLCRNYMFPGSRSFLLVVLFILFTAGMPEYETLHPVWFAMVFLLLAVDRLFVSYDIRKPYDNIFKTGFLLGIGSLFYFNLLLLLPAFIIGGRVLARDGRWRESCLVVLGTIVPWIFAFATYILLDKTDDLSQMIEVNFMEPRESVLKNIPRLAYLGFMGLLIISGSFTILKQYSEKKVKFRRLFTFFFLMFVCAVLSFFLVPAVSSEIFILAAVPVSFLLSNYFESFRHNLFPEVVFALIIGFVIFLQFLYNGQNIIT